MNWQSLSAAIPIAFVVPILYLYGGNIETEEMAAGQMEETFSLNSTFLKEVEQEQNETVNLSPRETEQQMQKQQQARNNNLHPLLESAPMVVSQDNAYVVWGTNETGNWEIMFRASDDEGLTFGDKINLSNSTETDSQNPELIAAGDKVLVSWQERSMTNGTSEYVLRTSDDGGMTFGPSMQLSSDGPIGDRKLDFFTYEDSEYGTQIGYPREWEIDEEGADDPSDGAGDLAGFYSPLENRLDDYRERLWLSVDTLQDRNMTVEEYRTEVINNKNSTLRDFNLLDSDTESIVLSGYPAYRVVSTQSVDEDRIVKQMETGTLVGDRVYYLIYYAEEDKYEDYLPIIQDMIDSFEITG
jgi:hypothetical protein